MCGRPGGAFDQNRQEANGKKETEEEKQAGWWRCGNALGCSRALQANRNTETRPACERLSGFSRHTKQTRFPDVAALFEHL